MTQEVHESVPAEPQPRSPTGVVRSKFSTMTAERRADLVEELIAWADDPRGADWEYIDKLS